MSKDANPNAGTGAAGEGQGEGQNGDTGTGTDNAGSAGTGAAAGTSGTKAITMTQDELDAIVERRLAKERRDNAQTAADAQKWRDHEASQATEAEKAEAKQKEREAAIAARETAANERLLRAECLQAVREAKIDSEFEDLVIEALIGSEGVEVTDKGKVEGVKEALSALVKDKPKLVAGETKAPDKSGGEFRGAGARPTIEEQLAELEKKGPAGVREAIALKLKNRKR